MGGWVKNWWGVMNKEHVHRCSGKLFTPFFRGVLPAAFSLAYHWTTKAGTGEEVLCEEKMGWEWRGHFKLNFCLVKDWAMVDRWKPINNSHLNYIYVFVEKFKRSNSLLLNIFFRKHYINNWNINNHLVTALQNREPYTVYWFVSGSASPELLLVVSVLLLRFPSDQNT